MKILAGAIDFGLGPIGKLASIINSLPEVKWFACGNKIDINIFNSNPFQSVSWTRNKDILAEFIKKNHLSIAIVVLDPELAILLQELGLIVLYIDSLPFLWTKNDLVPYNASYYFAQLCYELPPNCWEHLCKINNLKWIYPIVPNYLELIQNKKKNKYNTYDVVINLGGLHNPFGSGIEYAEIILIPLLMILQKNNYNHILILCGSTAIKKIEKFLNENSHTDIHYEVKIMPQFQFHTAILNSQLFITSPGLTTLYETFWMKTKTIVLPPQNLSQYYNIRFVSFINKNAYIINWDNKKLEFKTFEPFLYKGEEYIVKKIYKEIKKLLNNNEVHKKLKKKIESAIANVNNNYSLKHEHGYVMNGTNQIINIIHNIDKNRK